MTSEELIVRIRTLDPQGAQQIIVPVCEIPGADGDPSPDFVIERGFIRRARYVDRTTGETRFYSAEDEYEWAREGETDAVACVVLRP